MNEDLKIFNVLVTRPKHQAETLCRMIEQHGWNAIRFPTLDIVGANNQLIQSQLSKIEQWHWLIFISANAVKFAIKANNGKIDRFQHSSIAAVGIATKKALHEAGLSVDLVPETEFNTEGLLDTDAMHQVNDKHCLIIRGAGGRELLRNDLMTRGAIVDYMEVYTRVKPVSRDPTLSDMLLNGRLDAITITSGDALTNLLLMIGDDLRNHLLKVPLIVISHRIKRLAEKYKFKHIAVTEMPADTAIIKTVRSSLTH